MRLQSFILSFIPFIFFLSSCQEKKQSSRQKDAEKNSFYESPPTLSLRDLDNELSTSPSHFLKTFENDQIPWQNWSPKILEKAQAAQKLILVLVGSPSEISSRKMLPFFNKNESIRKTLSENYLCTLVDTHTHPEIATFCDLICSENRTPLVFPVVLFLSHEGNVLTSRPISNLSEKKLSKIINGISDVVNDTWIQTPRYTIEDSREKGETRQERIDSFTPSSAPLVSQQKTFHSGARNLLSLYNDIDQVIDSSGGLIPTQSLELLTIASQSSLLSDEDRALCKRAVLTISEKIQSSSIKDHLDQSYFYARQSTDWSIPLTVKNFSSLCLLANLFITAGDTFDKPEMAAEGLQILEKLENDWLTNSRNSLLSQTVESEKPTFLWNFKNLENALTTEEIEFAKQAFSLNEKGNIPIYIDPKGTLKGSNALKRTLPLSQLARNFSISQEAAQSRLSDISQKMLTYRNSIAKTAESKGLTAEQIALLANTQITRATHTKNTKDQASAIASVESILEKYLTQDGLSRISYNGQTVPARSIDYSYTALALINLYQITLDEKWISHADAILNEAFQKLSNETPFLSEIPLSEKIINVRTYQFNMLFGDSSQGTLYQALTKINALIDKEKYKKAALAQYEKSIYRSTHSPVAQTDDLIASAYGEQKILAILHGDITQAAAQEMLQILNERKHSAFLVIRSSKPSSQLKPLKNLTFPAGETSVTLTKGDKKIGTANTPSKLRALLKKQLSQK